MRSAIGGQFVPADDIADFAARVRHADERVRKGFEARPGCVVFYLDAAEEIIYSPFLIGAEWSDGCPVWNSGTKTGVPVCARNVGFDAEITVNIAGNGNLETVERGGIGNVNLLIWVAYEKFVLFVFVACVCLGESTDTQNDCQAKCLY